jgi:alkylglycerol monooxygenase
MILVELLMSRKLDSLHDEYDRALLLEQQSTTPPEATEEWPANGTLRLRQTKKKNSTAIGSGPAIDSELIGRPSGVARPRLFRLCDSICSLSAGIFLQILESSLYIVFPIGIAPYIWIWNNMSIPAWRQPLDTMTSWIITLVFVDFMYYWLHRLAHELNIFWAAHATHHSSNDYNFTTALRQSGFQKAMGSLVYLPLALIFPPELFACHTQLNAFFQFWVHTQVIRDLGPIEYILMTPSHHRVHHGRNRYCIDTNYGGIFVVWDILFGTFEWERTGLHGTVNEPVVYGLVFPQKVFNLVTVQFVKFKYILRGVLRRPNWINKFKRVFYGPGWSEGKPRMGIRSDLPAVDPNSAVKVHMNYTWMMRIFLCIKLAMLLVCQMFIDATAMDSSLLAKLVLNAHLLYHLMTLSYNLDNRPYAQLHENCALASSIALYFLMTLTSFSVPGVFSSFFPYYCLASVAMGVVRNVFASRMSGEKVLVAARSQYD